MRTVAGASSDAVSAARESILFIEKSLEWNAVNRKL